MFFTDKMGFKKIRKLGLQAFVWVIESFLLEVHGFQGFPSAWLAKPCVLGFWISHGVASNCWATLATIALAAK